jgi:hypothetical protein
MTDYSTKFSDNIVSNLFNSLTRQINESTSLTFDYLNDNMENNNTNNSPGGSHHLALMLQHLFSKMSDNRTTYKIQPNSGLSSASLSFETLLKPSSQKILIVFFHLYLFGLF